MVPSIDGSLESNEVMREKTLKMLRRCGIVVSINLLVLMVQQLVKFIDER